MRDEQMEQKIQDAGCDAPRLTPDDISDVIVDEDFHVFPGTSMTVCCLTLANGFTVIGQAASADLRNFRQDIGREIAREDAKQKVWMLEGYLLRDRINRGEV